MKIQSLKISSFRGIIFFDESFKQKSAIFFGENGTGKSGIIDAVDFLINGKIRRLTGEGSAELSLDAHGLHITRPINDSWVSAVVKLKNKQQIEVKRTLKTKKLELINGSKEDFAIFEETSSSGQQLLSRKEILRFITCESGERSKGIQELLDLSQADKIRTDLSAQIKKAERAHAEAKILLSSSEANLKLALAPTNNSLQAWVEAVNKNRAAFAASPVSAIDDTTDVLSGIAWETKALPMITRNKFRDATSKLDLLSLPALPSGPDGSPESKFAQKFEECIAFPNFATNLQRVDLINKGIQLLGTDDDCPLCDKEWKNNALLEHLKRKREQSAAANTLKADYDRSLLPIVSRIDTLANRLQALSDTLTSLSESETEKHISKWRQSLLDRKTKISSASSLPTTLSGKANDQSELLAYPENFSELKQILEKIELKLPEESTEETAFKALVEANAALKDRLKARLLLRTASAKLDTLYKVDAHFAKARSGVFDVLYKEIEADFVRYYRMLNEDDESGFEANLIDKGRTVDLKVDFYNKGKFPPNALHSEGHQDSMGICLYLALMKRLQAENFTLALLDDIMMSIDTNHRKRLCRLLSSEFSDTQFLITTHDRIWAKQLTQHGLVQNEFSFEFANWSLETGPIHTKENSWNQIDKLVSENKCIEAAARLRRTLEHDFQDIAETLRSKVTFKHSVSWDLGELKGAALGSFKDALDWSIAAATKYNNTTQLEQLSSIRTRQKLAAKNAGVDNWEINPIVHFNSWQNFGKSELAATVRSQKELVEAFKCSTCKATYTVALSMKSHDPETFGCTCSKFPMQKPKKS